LNPALTCWASATSIFYRKRSAAGGGGDVRDERGELFFRCGLQPRTVAPASASASEGVATDALGGAGDQGNFFL